MLLNKLTVRDIALIAMLTAILSAQELFLSALPNVQISFLLVAVYGRVLGFKKTIAIVVLHTLIKNVVIGFNIMIVLPALIGWIGYTVINSLYRKDNLFLRAILCAFGVVFYASSFIPFAMYFFKVKFIPYLIADLYFTVPLILISCTTIFIAYLPIVRSFNSLNDIFDVKRGEWLDKVV